MDTKSLQESITKQLQELQVPAAHTSRLTMNIVRVIAEIFTYFNRRLDEIEAKLVCQDTPANAVLVNADGTAFTPRLVPMAIPATPSVPDVKS